LPSQYDAQVFWKTHLSAEWLLFYEVTPGAGYASCSIFWSSACKRAICWRFDAN